MNDKAYKKKLKNGPLDISRNSEDKALCKILAGIVLSLNWKGLEGNR